MSIGETAKKVLRRVSRVVGKSESRALTTAYEGMMSMARLAVNAVTPLQLGWGSSLQAVRWIDESKLEIEGWAFERGRDYVGSPPTTKVEVAEGPRQAPIIVSQVRIKPSAHVHRQSKDPNFDYSGTAFVAHIDAAELVRRAGGRAGSYRVFLGVEGGGAFHRGWFKSMRGGGSASYVQGRSVAGTWVQPTWERHRGLVLEVGFPTVGVQSVNISGRAVEIDLAARGVELVSGWLESDAGAVPLRLASVPGGVRVSGELPELDWLWEDAASAAVDDDIGDTHPRVHKLVHHLVVADSRRREYRPVLEIPEETPAPSTEAVLHPFAGSDGALLLGDAEVSGVVFDATLVLDPTPELSVRGLLLGPGDGVRIALAGRRQELAAAPELAEDGTFSVTIPLLASRWGSPPLAPMSGHYTLLGVTSDGRRFPIRATLDLAARTPVESLSEWFRVTEAIGKDRHFVLQIGAPLADDELGTFNQNRLERDYQKRRFVPSDSVYLESFYGRQATCNPLALDRVLAEHHPELRRFWGVVDRSVWTPEGSTPVVEGTRAWWDARGSARYVIANDWLRRKFLHQPHQVVLQTWHGSMLKRIGLDRPSAGKSTQEALRRERDKWDLLVSQNRHSTEIFKTAYEWTDGIVEEGYPRNDLMLTGDRQAVRRFLGIQDDQVAVLYAPTWRDNVEGLVTFLDLEKLTADLGPGYVILLRGHSRIMGQSSSVEIPGVIDVTTHPNITELFLAADAMVTDYSSVMFDFSVTGRPMIFFVPDMDDYRDSVRGVYFDLSEVAPGPVVATQDEVREAILSMDEDAPRYAEAYQAWRERFNALDDGGSALRVMERLLSTPPRGTN